MPRSKRDLVTTKIMTGVEQGRGDPSVTVTEYPWKVSAGQIAQEESLLPPSDFGTGVTNGRTAAINRRPPD